jgi:hypothetical protein
MSLRHPLLGVGPGNWAVVYPKVRVAGDPSSGSDGMTANPWPSSDWMTFSRSAGPVAFVLLALAMIALLVEAVRALRMEGDPEHALASWALLGTVSVLLVVSTFDAVLLLPAPAAHRVGPSRALSPPARDANDVALSDVRAGVGDAAGDDPWRPLDRTQHDAARAMSVYESSTRAAGSSAPRSSIRSYRIHLRLAET